MASLTASPASVANGAAPSGPSWSNPGNAATDNDVYATLTMNSESSTQYLEATNFDFSTIPVGATIDGLAATVRAFASGGVAWLDGAQFYRAGGGDWFTALTDFPAPDIGGTEGAHVAGGATELAGETWSRSDVLDSSFGVRFVAASVGEDVIDFSVDSITLTVYYTPVGGTAVAGKVVGVFQAINRASTY